MSNRSIILQHHSHSLIHLSIHPSTAACAPSIDVVSSRRLAAINRSVNPSISSINHHQPECDRRLRLRQSIDQSVRSIDHAINQSTHQPINQSPQLLLSIRNRSVISRAINASTQPTHQSISHFVQSINHSSASLSLTNPSIHRSIHCAPSIDVVSSRRLAAINRSVNPSISRSINAPRCQRSVEPPARNQSINQSIDRSINQFDQSPSA